MTTVDLNAEPVAQPGTHAPHQAWRRLANVVGLHLANPWPTLGLPWLIFIATFGLTYSIWQTVAIAAGGIENIDGDGFKMAGGASWIFVYMFIVAIQAMNRLFTIALGFSMTRKDYYLGTLAYFVAVAVYYAVGATALIAMEKATDGWGVDGAFFAPFGLDSIPTWQLGAAFFVVMLLMFGMGTAFGSVSVRWGGTGVIASVIAIAALLVGAMWIVGRYQAWDTVFAFFSDATTPQLLALVFVPTVALLTAGYFVLRKAAPRA